MLMLSIAAGTVLELADPTNCRFGFVLARIAGKAVGIYVLSGFLPLLLNGTASP